MEKIRKAALVGAGSLGIMYGQRLTEVFGKESVCFAADRERIRRYEGKGLYFNGNRCDFRYIESGYSLEKADLIIIAVKYTGLPEALEAVAGLVHPETIIISLINGITSENMIARAFGSEHVLYCIAQEMDATKTGNLVEASSLGYLVFNDKTGAETEQVRLLKEYLDRAGIPYRTPEDIIYAQWDKLVFNVGLNQSSAVFSANYGEVRKPGRPREVMEAAMREAVRAANAEGIPLTEDNISRWMERLERLSPSGMPSMMQDTRDGRKTEVELFSGTIIELGRRHGFETPVNDWLYQQIQEIERRTADLRSPEQAEKNDIHTRIPECKSRK